MLRLFIIVKWLDYGVILSIIQGERLMNQLTLATLINISKLETDYFWL